MKVIIVSLLVAFLVMFVLSALFNDLVVKEYVSENIDPTILLDSPDLALITLGYALLALLMTLIYPRVVNRASYSAWTGFLFGMVAGITWLLPYALVLHGIYRFPFLGLLIDPAWALLEQGIGGALIGMIHARFAKPESSF